MSEYRVVGTSRPRSDAQPRTTGETVYGMDVTLPGMLYGAVVRSREPHAEIVSIDTSRAEQVTGVRAVLTADDVPDMKLPFYIDDRPLLAKDRVRYQGEPIALVAAVSLEVAEHAADLVEVEYRSLPVIRDPEEALEPNAPLVHEDWESYRANDGLGRDGNVAGQTEVSRGDVEAAFADAAHIFEDRYKTHSVHQVHMEPFVAVAQVDSRDHITIHSNTQLPYRIRDLVAAVMDVPKSQVRVIGTAIGGGFGAKLFIAVEHFCALLARATGRPVRIATSVREDLTAAYPRHPTIVDIKTAVSEDGLITGRQIRMLMDTGAYAGAGTTLVAPAAVSLCGPYRIPNLEVSVCSVYTNKTDFGSYRAPTGPQSNFALESHMDRIAKQLGIDAVTFRLQHILEEGEEAANGQVVEGVGLRACIEKAAAAIDWEQSPTEPNRGKGIACGWWTTTGGASGCYARLQSDGTIAVHVGAAEIGTGAVSQGAAQVWAEAMGVDVDDIRLVTGDTDATPYDLGSQGSRTLFNLGNVALRTAEDLRQQIKELASELLEVDPQDLEIVDKAVRVKGSPEHNISLSDLAQQSLSKTGGLLARGTYIRPPTAGSPMAFTSPGFYCHAAEVHVDPVTGVVTIHKYAAAHDVGFAIYPEGVEGQIHGGVVQGIGMALMEELNYDDGRVANPNLTDYKVPTIADAPAIETIIVEQPNPDGPFGAKGVGEAPVIAPPATLANAIENATGLRLRALPLKPEAVLRGLQRAQDGT